ncbi:DUF6397 family protein [Streptomyces sp. NPDC001941]|uniref:DUF6397 family protein n=1 Tax=Streptomyces sp. NPDC001941 TaxID=3154659 RepID=UPI003323F6B1
MPAPQRSVILGRAAQELALKRSEFDLAVQLGHVRTVPGERGGRPRVSRQELDRLRAAPDFPDALRERVRAVGTAEAAALIGATPVRFTALAKAGLFSPTSFYLNRYRAVVWLYLAGELREFAAARPELLKGRLPEETRRDLALGQDRRPRNWRARRLGLLLRASEDPWQSAAAVTLFLDPDDIADLVPDPRERNRLDALRPGPLCRRPDSPKARDITERLVLVQDPEEAEWYRASLTGMLRDGRTRELLESGPSGLPLGPGLAVGRPFPLGTTHAASWMPVPRVMTEANADGADSCVPVRRRLNPGSHSATVAPERDHGRGYADDGRRPSGRRPRKGWLARLGLRRRAVAAHREEAPPPEQVRA